MYSGVYSGRCRELFLSLEGMEGKYNLHTHSTYCDGRDAIKDMIEHAIELDFSAIGFSGHEYTPFDESYCMSLESIEKYMDDLNRLKKEYKDDILVLAGIERDYYSPHTRDDFDFVIGSVHYVKAKGKYYSIDHSRELIEHAVKEGFDGDIRKLIEAYYTLVGDIYNKTECDIVGHFDVISKFDEDNSLFDRGAAWYRDAALKALDSIDLKATAVEINTGGVAKGYRTSFYPEDFILEEIKRRGGMILKNSDCHDRRKLDFGLR